MAGAVLLSDRTTIRFRHLRRLYYWHILLARRQFHTWSNRRRPISKESPDSRRFGSAIAGCDRGRVATTRSYTVIGMIPSCKVTHTPHHLPIVSDLFLEPHRLFEPRVVRHLFRRPIIDMNLPVGESNCWICSDSSLAYSRREPGKVARHRDPPDSTPISGAPATHLNSCHESNESPESRKRYLTAHTLSPTALISHRTPRSTHTSCYERYFLLLAL